MSNIVLKVDHVKKQFNSYKSLFQRILSWFNPSIKPLKSFDAVKDITFNLHKGESIGLIGQNGAGKSTLLKLIVGTIQPTKGKIQVYGKVSAILELGIGFNPALTGYENIKQTAGLLGYSQKDIEKIIPDIEDFAEIGEFFHQEFRTYSSGMQARLAFSLATATRPEILIIDEVLAVGDAYFQHKSFNRIREFREQGSAILMVTHDRGAIQSICDKAILIENGLVIREGPPEEVFDFYNAIIADKENKNIQTKEMEDGKIQVSSGTGEAKVIEIGLYDKNENKVEFAGVGDKLTLKIKVKCNTNLDKLVLGYSIKDRLGQIMFGTNTWHTQQIINEVTAGDTFVFSIKFNANFGVGSYSIQTALVDSDTHLTANYEWVDLAYIFSLVNNDKYIFNGCIWNDPEIEIQKLIT